MKKAVLFFLFFCINSLIAQEYVNLFQNDLTDRIKFESFSRQKVDKELESASKIHPELLYYYILYYNVKYDGKVEPEYRISEEALGEARGQYLRSRNKWFSLAEQNLKAIEKDSSLLAGEIQYLYKYNSYKDLTIHKVCDSCYKTDKNKLNYFVYKFYTNDNNMSYQSGKDYVSLRKEYEINTKIKLEEDLKKFTHSHLSMINAEDDYKKIINMWYLFNETDKKESTPVLFTKLAFTDYIRTYKLNENVVVSSSPESLSDVAANIWKKSGISLILNYNNILLRSFNYQNTSNTAEPKINNNFDIPSNMIFAGISFSIKLPAGSLLTNVILDTELGTSLSETTLLPSYPDQLPPYKGSGPEETWISDKMVPEKNNIKVKRINGVSLKIKTPVLFVGDNLSFGIGGAAELFSLSYVTNLDFYFRKIWRGVNYAGQVVTYPESYFRETIDGEESTKIIFKIYPLLTAEYNLSRNLSFNLEASLNYYVAGFSYNLKL